MNATLFEQKAIRLAPIDPEQDAEVESRWSHDPHYLRALGVDPALPLSVSQVRKQYETIEKDAEEQGNLFHFAIRTQVDDRLVGFARLEWVDWANGAAWLKMGIGDPGDRRRGYGSQTLDAVLRYSFDELNLHRITVAVPEYNEGALRFFQRAGFLMEVRRRQALHREGRRWDLNLLGTLQAAWRQSA